MVQRQGNKRQKDHLQVQGQKLQGQNQQEGSCQSSHQEQESPEETQKGQKVHS